MSIDEPDVHRQMGEIRNLINEGRKHYELSRDKGKFSQMCSSLDVIEDSEQAITAFESSDFGEDVAFGYLAIYGVLQAAYLQQDALRNLCEALAINVYPSSCQSLKELREVRNASVGHPTKQDRKKPTAYNQISQITMGVHGFDLLTFTDDGGYGSRRVGLPRLITGQRHAVNDTLLKIIEELKKERESYKAQFRMNKLARALPDTMSYYCEKVGEGVDGGAVGLAGLAVIKSAFASFRSAALERNLDLAVHLNYHYATIDHVIVSLERFLNAGYGDPLTARVFVEYLSGRIGEMRSLAQEIDQDYAKKD